MSFIKELNKPYPQILNKWKTILSIGLFISLFILLFQPFGLQNTQIEHKGLRLAGYGLITVIVLIFDTILLPILFPKIFNEDKWTVKKQIFWLCWIVISISIGNYLYSIVFFLAHWNGVKGFFMFIVHTLAIAVIPIIAEIYVTYSIYLRNNLISSEIINKQISKSNEKKEKNIEEISFISGNQNFSLKIDNLIYIESEGNYINIWYLEKFKVKSKLIRNSIKNIESELNSNMLFKCHRAFIINLSFVKKVKGNSQGYNLVVNNIDKELPVARSYTKKFKEKMIKQR